MKELFINKTMNLITSQKNYNKTQLEEIRYGLVSIYLTFSKLIVISIIACLLGIFKEMVIFLIIYNILRSVSFGLHASKSWICLLSSTFIFIGGTILCQHMHLNRLIITIIAVITIFLIYKYSPADTKKRPIVNPKRRKIFKYLSTTFAVTYYIIAITIPNHFISNCILLSLIIQSIFIHPLTYKISKEPYDNYKKYKKN